MIIDWYTIIFQIINFMILVFLLRRFLYGPVIRAMDDREKKIIQREKDASAKKKQAEEEAQRYQSQKAALKEQEEEIFEKAQAAAEKQKRELLDQARQEVDQTKRRWQESFEREKETFISELRRRIGQQACAVARSCLKDLADTRLEKLIWEVFLNKLKNLPEEDRLELKKALEAEGGTITLKSAFETKPGQLKELEKALEKLFSDAGADFKLAAAIEEGLICGLELDAGGYRLAWSMDSYLEDVEEQVLKELEQNALSGQKAGAEREVSGNGRS